ncbi:hypothetical protein LCGC14_2923370 [marine sediment metagenome]|uniref:Uncharacterized protein n=1 Tax=marine sediment metagenome TaxID=412755 RepID=A0A0F8ZVS1_9ZZZZ
MKRFKGSMLLILAALVLAADQWRRRQRSAPGPSTAPATTTAAEKT